MKIAICDDDRQTLLHLSSLMETYRHKRDPELTYTTFQNASELLSVIRGGTFDVLLLDVLMPGISGMQAAHEIRDFDREVKIIFLTSSPEFAVESYGVQAHYYLLKPARTENLFPILNNLLDARVKQEEAFVVKTQSSIFRLPFAKIEYLEVNSKKLYFHMADGSTREARGCLADYEQPLLNRPDFIKTHRSYLMNLRLVQEFCVHEITTISGKKVPVSRDSSAAAKAAYLKYLLSGRGTD